MSANEQPCGCEHTKSSIPLRAIAEFASEPLVAISEDDLTEVYGCGSSGCDPSVSHPFPSSMHIERITKNAEGVREIIAEKELTIPQSLQEAWSVDHHTCLPWVKLVRDPVRFRSCLKAARAIGPVRNSTTFFKLIREYMLAQDQEGFYVLMLDTQGQIRGISEIARGARDRTLSPIPDILRLAIVDGAMGICVAHNHPSGKVNPSKADIELTRTLEEACDMVHICLVDHIIGGAADEFYSFQNKKIIKL